MKVEDIDTEEFLSFTASAQKPCFKDLDGLIRGEEQISEIFLEQFEEPDKKKIIAVIRLEPSLITGDLIAVDDKCKNPRHCVVGALFYHAGVSNKRLRELQGRYGAGVESLPVWAHEKLWKHYRLTPLHTNTLMDGNDGGSNTYDLIDDDDETCSIVNKKDLIKEVLDLEPLTSDDLHELLEYADKKGARDFFKPFMIRAYNEWITLGSKALINQVGLIKQRLHLKAKKKK